MLTAVSELTGRSKGGGAVMPDAAKVAAATAKAGGHAYVYEESGGRTSRGNSNGSEEAGNAPALKKRTNTEEFFPGGRDLR